jgi:hypothetical protein
MQPKLNYLKEYFELDNLGFEFSKVEDLMYHIKYDVEKRQDLNKYLFFVADWKVRNTLRSKFGITDIQLKKSIRSTLPIDRRQLILNELRKTSLKYPETYMAFVAILFNILFVIFMMILYWTFMIKNFEILFSIPGPVNLGVSLFFSVLPLLILNKFLPDFFADNYFVKISSYEDFIDSVVEINRENLIANGSALLKKELETSIIEFSNGDVCMSS